MLGSSTSSSGRAGVLAVLGALALAAAVVPAVGATAATDPSVAMVQGVSVTAPSPTGQLSGRSLTRSGGTIAATSTGVHTQFGFSLGTDRRTVVAAVRVVVRSATGAGHVQSDVLTSVNVNGTKDLRAATNVPDGSWIASVHLSVDGTTWGQGPGTALSVSAGRVTATGVAPAPSTTPSPAASPTASPSPAESPTSSPSPADTANPSPTASPTTSTSPTPTTSPSPTASPSPTSSPTGNSVHRLGYFYRPPVGADLAGVAATHARYILTKGDETTRDALKAHGGKGPFLQYLRFEAVMDDTGLGYQWHNQVAWKPGDWQDISTNHPDWFLLDTNGNRMKAGIGGDAEERFYLMDPMNAGWRAFFLQRMKEMQTQFGWDGVFLDNVELSLAKRQRTGQLPAKYPDDASYRAAVQSFLEYLDAQYFTPTGRPVEANLIEQRHGNDPAWHDALGALDGAMREGWVAGWDFDTLRDEWSWLRNVEQLEQSQAAGKHVWVVDFGRKDDLARQQYSYASFLLAADGRATYRYTDWTRYKEVWSYENYGLDLGAPLGPRYKVGNVWKRDFTGGTVTVDPTAGTSSIDVA